MRPIFSKFKLIALKTADCHLSMGVTDVETIDPMLIEK